MYLRALGCITHVDIKRKIHWLVYVMHRKPGVE